MSVLQATIFGLKFGELVPRSGQLGPKLKDVVARSKKAFGENEVTVVFKTQNPVDFFNTLRLCFHD